MYIYIYIYIHIYIYIEREREERGGAEECGGARLTGMRFCTTPCMWI